MKKVCLLFVLLIIANWFTSAQSIADRLRVAVSALEKDAQLRHGIVGIIVMDAKTGKTIFAKNEQIGLAPASTQKIITSASGFEILGKDFKFNTYISYEQSQNGAGNLYITGTGDPTLGSWRWPSTREEEITKKIVAVLTKQSIRQIGDIRIDDFSYTFQPVPDGWIWQDIGNYYGAGCWGLNWRENQYDLTLRSGKNLGDTTEIIDIKPEMRSLTFANFILSAKKNSGDNGFIYAPPYSTIAYTLGTIPVQEQAFTISGSMPQPAAAFSTALIEKLQESNISIFGQSQLHSTARLQRNQFSLPKAYVDSISSPAFDSINYWFMRKSINLYGEALLKAIASQGTRRSATTEAGVELVKNFWSARGIEKSAINIIDGSGLSPQNRVTAHALAKILHYAKSRNWYQSFYLSLPVYNGMKLKSGSIRGARSFAGYHTSASGKEYVVAIMVNNYDGSSAEIVNKMYRLLDVLK